jgi:hypothetical protein
MSSSANHHSTDLGLSRAEAWVVHAALLSAIESAVDGGTSPHHALALLRQIEAGDDRFDTAQLRYLGGILSGYLKSAPPRDVGPARAVLAGIEYAV